MDDLGISSLIGAGLPLLFLWLGLAAAFIRKAKRKGINPTLALIGAFPVWALFFGIWLISRPNKNDPTAEEDTDEESTEMTIPSH